MPAAAQAWDGPAPGALCRPVPGVHLLPVRHHSPACAWAVRALIREVRPRHVLVEAPVDFEPLIPLVLDAETRPPVAIAALVRPAPGSEARLAAYYPFCAHSPEYVALVEAAALGARPGFIDLPSADPAMWRRAGAEVPAPPDAPPAGAPVLLGDEARFDRGDFIRALAARAGCRDGFELWDHLFETRLGEADGAALLDEVAAYCAALRAATPPEAPEWPADRAREAHMAARIRAALRHRGPVVVVAGGFHLPALAEALQAGARTAPPHPKTAATADSWLIRYGFAELDGLLGYGAGLPSPGFYDFLWRAANEPGRGADFWQRSARALVLGFAAAARREGAEAPALPAIVETLRAAAGLAALRGRPGPMRDDLLDAARLALVKGEAGPAEPWTGRLTAFLRGEALGEVPPAAGLPPLVEDARRTARLHRLDLEDGAWKRRSLDIRRKPRHRQTGRFLHAMALLDSGFCALEAGPDFLAGIRTDLLFEDWRYAWSPAVEGRLIELSPLGDSVPQACLRLLERRHAALTEAGRARNAGAAVDLLAQGLLAGLGVRLVPFLGRVLADIQSDPDFAAVAAAFRRLHAIGRARGPLGAEGALDVGPALAAAFARLLYLLDDLPATAEDRAEARVHALADVFHLLAEAGEAGAADRALFTGRVAALLARDSPPLIAGALEAVAYLAGQSDGAGVAARLAGSFRGAWLDETARIATLRGLLAVAPQLLWRIPAVLEATDAFLQGLDEPAFLALLPHLRLALAALGPAETDRVAELVARRHGAAAGRLASGLPAVTEAERARALAAEARLRAAIVADGLAEWLLPEDPP